MVLRVVRLLRSRIALKLALTLVGVVGVTAVAAGLYLHRALEAFAVESLEARLATAGRALAREARALVEEGRTPEALHAFARRAAEATGARVTVIATDGRVLAESDLPLEALAGIENHAGRPEVQAAVAGGLGRDLRTSVTVGRPFLYVAVPLERGPGVVGVLRLALPLAAVSASRARLERVLLAGGLVALVAAAAIGVLVARRITRPVRQMEAIARRMSEGDFSAHVPGRSPDEVGALGRELNVMAARLKQKIEDLERAEAKVTTILNGLVEGVLAVDHQETILFMNERARTMLGITIDRAQGRPLLEVVRNADVHAIFREVRGARPAAAVRQEIRRSGPVEATLQVTGLPLRLTEDEPGVLMVLHDVSELRRLEQARTEFVANVSHELRTPLTAIRGYLETLLGGALEDGEQARQFVEIAFRHTERLGRLVDDLTDLSNIELGKIRLDLQPAKLDEVVPLVLDVIRPRAERAGVALVTELETPSLTVLADRDRLEQILINLLDNAVKFTPRGGTATLRARRTPDGAVEVAVSDTGIGIPRRDLPRVTERFYRVDRARSRELGGTGLGLAIVKHLVVAHGGAMAIESEEGKGTTVRFSLPAAVPERAA